MRSGLGSLSAINACSLTVIALIVYQLGLLFSGAGFGVGTVVAFVLLAGLVYLLVRKNPYDSNHLSQNVKVNA